MQIKPGSMNEKIIDMNIKLNDCQPAAKHIPFPVAKGMFIPLAFLVEFQVNINGNR